MCAPSPDKAKGVPAGETFAFDEKTKCCTFYPDLPNYLVGALLSDVTEELAEGRRRVREKIRAGIGVTPASMRPPDDYDSAFRAMPGAFGRVASFACPYYQSDGGRCTVWRHREAVCSTWFCRYAKGVDGKNFWESTKRYLVVIQAKLQWYALLKVAPNLVDVSIEASTRPSKDYPRLWRNWQGREEELYRRTHEEVSRLSSRDLERIVGIDGALELHMVEKSLAQLSTPLPERMMVNPALKISPRQNELILQTHTKFDTVAVSRQVFEMIGRFDGTLSNSEVRSLCLAENRSALDVDFIAFLYHQRVPSRPPHVSRQPPFATYCRRIPILPSHRHPVRLR